MRFGSSESEMVEKAFCLLKQSTYYDKTDLFLRANIAAYEADPDFLDRQIRVAQVAIGLRQNASSTKSWNIINKWLEQIEFRILPKSVTIPSGSDNGKSNSPETPRLITNVRTADKYVVPEGAVQYLIWAPVELYILDTLWCILVGPGLDKELDEGCFGNRLDPGDIEGEWNTSRLFKVFHYQYALWRNTAIQRAEDILEQGESSVIISMDIKKCYYHMNVDWPGLEGCARKVFGHESLSIGLTSLLQKIHSHYWATIFDCISRTHGEECANQVGIPIGLQSSRVIANSILGIFDQEVRDRLQPAYYGRYVDDMLVVARAPGRSFARADSTSILESLLISRGLLGKCSDRPEYSLCCLPELTIQGSKLFVQYFDKNHSRAGLKEFIELIKQDSSDFRFLPADERGRELDSCAYDILYEGSINKLRSVVGVAENSTELSKYLARRMIEHRLTSEPLATTVAEQLDRFSRGKNLLDYCETWERMLTLLIVKGQHEKAAALIKRCWQTIACLSSDKAGKQEWVLRTKSDLREYLEIALAMALALLSVDVRKDIRSKRLMEIVEKSCDKATEVSANLRKSNLLRHQWVAWPLLNYTQYSGPLVQLDEDALRALDCWDIDRAATHSPRYIHGDERTLFGLLRAMYDDAASWDDYSRIELETKEESSDVDIKATGQAVGEGTNSEHPSVIEIGVPGEISEKIIVGIANMHVSESDIADSYKPLRAPNTSWDRQAHLFNLLNLAEKENCDLFVMPEVSIPYSWLPFMVAHARNTQSALVFGMEHWVAGGDAYNFIVTVLPYRENDKYRACHVFVRPKNHYSPFEVSELGLLGLCPGKDRPIYHLFDWRGVRFTVFNCYELSNIKHRAMLRADVDMIVSVEWNRDTKYYANIVESTVRDLHCYVVQVNTSQYGDSRVTAPKRSEEMNEVQVSGGVNSTLLKAEIDIAELNEFRCKAPSQSDKRFKPTSAGFEHDRIRRRRR